MIGLFLLRLFHRQLQNDRQFKNAVLYRNGHRAVVSLDRLLDRKQTEAVISLIFLGGFHYPLRVRSDGRVSHDHFPVALSDLRLNAYPTSLGAAFAGFGCVVEGVCKDDADIGIADLIRYTAVKNNVGESLAVLALVRKYRIGKAVSRAEDRLIAVRGLREPVDIALRIVIKALGDKCADTAEMVYVVVSECPHIAAELFQFFIVCDLRRDLLFEQGVQGGVIVFGGYVYQQGKHDTNQANCQQKNKYRNN